MTSSPKHLSRQPDVVGARVARLRNAMNMTQVDFAKESGIPRQSLSGIEMGYRRPTVEQAFLLVDRFKVSLSWIYEGKLDCRVHPDVAEAIMSTPEVPPVYDPETQPWREEETAKAVERSAKKLKPKVILKKRK